MSPLKTTAWEANISCDEEHFGLKVKQHFLSFLYRKVLGFV